MLANHRLLQVQLLEIFEHLFHLGEQLPVAEAKTQILLHIFILALRFLMARATQDRLVYSNFDFLTTMFLFFFFLFVSELLVFMLRFTQPSRSKGFSRIHCSQPPLFITKCIICKSP